MGEGVCITPADFELLKRELPAITREQLFKVYAISETTWRKLREGRPVKRSTLERMLSRYRRLLEQRAAQDSDLGQAFRSAHDQHHALDHRLRDVFPAFVFDLHNPPDDLQHQAAVARA